MAASDKLARYRYVSPLGRGGMATVVLAQDTLLGRQVALKRVSAATDARGLVRLRREALVGASISHDNLVSIYDVVDAEAGDMVIVMEYVQGQTLRQLLNQRGRLVPVEALRILEGVAAGLDTLHQAGIVHRDVKPSNILLGDDGAVKLADLGIASVPDRSRITTTGSVLGSLSYMAPEQLSDARATAAIDVYALAAVTFEVLSGRRARRAPNAMALAHAISTRPPPDLRDAWTAAPPAVADLLTRAMARDPSERPRSAGELVRRLRASLDPATTARYVPPARPAPPASAPPPSEPRRPASPARAEPPSTAAAPVRSLLTDSGGAPGRFRRLRPASVLALLAAVAAAIVVVVLVSHSSSPAPRSSTSAARSAATGSKHHATGSANSSTSSGTTSSGSVTSAAADTSPAGGPVAAVKSFYTLAAAHQYAAAWALADPTFRGQLGGYDSFQGGQAGDKSITFHTAKVVAQSSDSATVSVTTTSVRDDGTHQCSGTVDLSAGGSSGGWLLHTIQINCS